jgi:hypothetical protein
MGRGQWAELAVNSSALNAKIDHVKAAMRQEAPRNIAVR